jgi:hypothetical protein
VRIGNRQQAVSNSKKLKLVACALGALLFPLWASIEAQQAVKIPRIGFLEGSTASTIAVRLEAFRQELRRLGWIEEKNITVEYRFAEPSVSEYLS